MAYGSSQARGQIGAEATVLGHSHGNARSESRLCPTRQLTAMPDSQSADGGPGLNLRPHGSQSGLLLLSHIGNSNYLFMYVCMYVFMYFLFRATPTTYESSQARGLIGAAAAGLHHSNSNAGSELHL